MALWVFDPTVLTNASFVTTDTGAALGFFASAYAFYRFVIRMSWQKALTCGLAVGVALACKHNAVLLLPILLLLAVGELSGRWLRGQRFPKTFCLRMITGMIAIAAVALTVLWGAYSFRFAMHPVGVSMPPLKTQVQTLSPLMSNVVTSCPRATFMDWSTLSVWERTCRRIPSASSMRRGNGFIFQPSSL